MNALGRDIKPGERLVIKKERMMPEYQAIERRIFIAVSGPGMMKRTDETRINGHFEIDGHVSWIMGREIDVNETMELQSVEVTQ